MVLSIWIQTRHVGIGHQLTVPMRPESSFIKCWKPSLRLISSCLELTMETALPSLQYSTTISETRKPNKYACITAIFSYLLEPRNLVPVLRLSPFTWWIKLSAVDACILRWTGASSDTHVAQADEQTDGFSLFEMCKAYPRESCTFEFASGVPMDLGFSCSELN